MNLLATATLVTTILAAPAFADSHVSGDAEAGEKIYKKCKSCHKVTDGDTAIQKGGKTGPDLFAINGRMMGSQEGFRYSKSLKALGESEENVWDEAEFIAWLANPGAYIKDKTGDSKAKTKMSFKLKKEEDAANLWAYLVSVGPELEVVAE